jgi:hypothetical protein
MDEIQQEEAVFAHTRRHMASGQVARDAIARVG